jgi:HAD superfamily hydrolase (TIGR01509 family)
MIDAIFWDNDGVLVDTEPLFLQANRETLAEVGIEFGDALYRDISLVQGRSIFTLAQERGLGEQETLALRAKRDLRYAALLDTGVEVLDGIPECLAALHGRVPMAIVTSSQKTHFARIHAQTQLLDYFEDVVAGGDYERHKPHPDPYLEGARRLGVSPEHCLAIEDTERGLLSAVAAGMRCIAIPRPLSRDSDFGTAHGVLESARGITSIVDELLT